MGFDFALALPDDALDLERLKTTNAGTNEKLRQLNERLEAINIDASRCTDSWAAALSVRGSEAAEGLRVTWAGSRPISVGDTIRTRHGGGGVVARVIPAADMPVLLDGTPVEVLMSPPDGRQPRWGEVFEGSLAFAAAKLRMRLEVPIRLQNLEAIEACLWNAAIYAWACDLLGITVSKPDPKAIEEQMLESPVPDPTDRAGKQTALSEWVRARERELREAVGSLGAFSNHTEPLATALRRMLGATGNSCFHLRDGRTGELMDQPCIVGFPSFVREWCDDQLRARSTGDYCTVAQQPIGTTTPGETVDEQTIDALIAHGAAFNLLELTTVKSDDREGRAALSDAIVRDEEASHVPSPAALEILRATLRGLAISFERATTTAPTD